ANKHPLAQVLVVLIIGSWALSIIGRMLWYSVYPAVFIYAGAGFLLCTMLKSKSTLLLKRLLIITLIVNCYSTYAAWRSNHKLNTNYPAYAQTLAAAIPKNSTVFLSAIPDPYHALIHANKNLTLFEFP